jgi:septum formation protein
MFCVGKRSIRYFSDMEKIKIKPSFILASKSPRRRDLLLNAGLIFDIVPSEINENAYSVSVPKTYAGILAGAKAADVSKRYPDCWVIGADSIVEIDGHVLEKPTSISEARQMIHMLSGNTHYVHTGYAIAYKKNFHYFCDIVSTSVSFKSLTEKEIEWYIHTSEPYDKAGGYAIQGLGSFMVKHINGSYTNVVGLPVCEVIDYLYKQGVITRDESPIHQSSSLS